jgi:L-ascorbate metabolism protein UlaG (beta-lactamase superfamily)
MQMLFNWIGGATFILSIDDLNIAVDPVLCERGTILDFFWFKSKRIEQPVYLENDFENIDLWLITHNHEDHLDRIGLSKISKSTEIVCNKNCYKILHESGKNRITILNWKQKRVLLLKGYRIEIEAIPAVHGVNPLSAFFAGKVNGYYLTISKGENRGTIYITGDTVYKSKIIRTLEKRAIDLLIPNMGAAGQGSWIMTLTLNSKMLERMIFELKPKIIIPVHYGTFEHYHEPVEIIKQINDSRITIVEVGSKTEVKFYQYQTTI